MRKEMSWDREAAEIDRAIKQESIEQRRAVPGAEEVNFHAVNWVYELLTQTPCQRCGGVAEGFWLYGAGKNEVEGRKINYNHYINDMCYPMAHVKQYFLARAIMCDNCGSLMFGKGGLYQTNKRAGELFYEAKTARNPHIKAKAWRECLEVRKVLAVMAMRDRSGTEWLSTLHLPVSAYPEWYVPKQKTVDSPHDVSRAPQSDEPVERAE